MPRTVPRALSSLCAVALLAACGSDSAGITDPGPTDPPAPTTARLQIDYSFIEAVKDCDGIEGDGDFSFRVVALLSSGTSSPAYSASRTLGSGDRTPTIGRKTYEVSTADGQQVTIQFTASEHDKNVLGAEYLDSRMSNVSGTYAHRLNGGTWSGLGAQSITLGGGDCQVRLLYTATGL